MKVIATTFLNHGIRLSLIPYLGIIFVLTAFGSWQAFLTHSTWHIGDWLINYQGGFVRRGLLGEFIYQISSYTDISPGFYVFLFQVFFNGFFLFFSYLLLKKQNSLLPYLLLIFSPFLFTFQINSFDQIESQGGYFKECIYCCILAFTGWSAVAFSEKTFRTIFTMILLFYPLAILTHESFAIFLPFLLMVYLIKIELNTKRFMALCCVLSLSIISFVFCLCYTGNQAQVAAIYQSLLSKYPVSTYGSIGWLMMPTQAAFERVLIQIHYNQYFMNYGLIIGLSLIAFVPLLPQLKLIFKTKLSCLLFITSLVGTALLCCVAIDWGRFIRILLVSLFILSLVAGTEVKTNSKQHSLMFIAGAFLFILCYALLWRIPNCCNYRPPVSSWATNNLIWSYQPYKKLVHEVGQAINRV